MWNKFLSILAAVSLTVSLSAQQYRTSRRYRGRQTTTTVQQKKTAEKTSAQPTSTNPPTTTASARPSGGRAKFDPKKTALTQSQIDYVMNDLIRKKLLECKISAKLPGHKDDNEDTSEDGEKTEDGGTPVKFAFVSLQDFSRLMSRYTQLIANFELIEVSNVRPEWYQKYKNELNKFGPIINEMTFAIRFHSSERYSAGVQKFNEHQKACLKFLKAKPPRISKEQYAALVLKNTKIRQQNYLKRLREEQEAAMKRRQEQLKQLQLKNQPKNQANQKPAQAGGK